MRFTLWLQPIYIYLHFIASNVCPEFQEISHYRLVVFLMIERGEQDLCGLITLKLLLFKTELHRLGVISRHSL